MPIAEVHKNTEKFFRVRSDRLIWHPGWNESNCPACGRDYRLLKAHVQSVQSFDHHSSLVLNAIGAFYQILQVPQMIGIPSEV